MKRVVLLIVILGLCAGAYYVFFAKGGEAKVIVVEHRGKLGGQDVTSRCWCAEDKARFEGETADSKVTSIVRLDRNEIWILDDKARACVVFPIDDVYANARQSAEKVLTRALEDPEWQRRAAALRSYLYGSYELSVSDNTVYRQGYECVEVRASVEGIFEATTLRATDTRIPESYGEASAAVATFGGRELGEGNRQLGPKTRRSGNLTVSSESWSRLPGRGARTIERHLIGVREERYDETLFDIPKGYTQRKP